MRTINLAIISNLRCDIVSKFEDAFSGEGQLEEKLHLKIDESVSVPQVVLPVRRVPFALKEVLKQELEWLVLRKAFYNLWMYMYQLIGFP